MSQSILRRFARQFVYSLWPWYLSGAFFLAASNIITLEIPQFAKKIVNSLQNGFKDNADLRQLALAIILLGLGQIIVRSLSRILIFWPGRKIEATSKSFLFRKVMLFPQSFYDRFGMGDLISRLSNDLGQLRVFFAFGVLQVLNLIFISSFTLYQMLRVHGLLTLFCLLPIVLMLVTTRFVMPRMQFYMKKNQEAIGTLTNRVTEAFTNVHVIQTNAAEQSFQDLISSENDKVYDSDMKVLLLRTLFFPLMTALTGLSQLVVLFYGGRLVAEGLISVGDILAFNIYLSFLAFPLTSIGIIISLWQRCRTSLDRIEPFFNSEVESSKDGIAAQESQALIQIKDLNFTYPSSPGPVLKDISLAVRKGEMLGICGPVGSGKSSLFQCLTRIYDPPPGTVFFEGKDILGIDPHQLRRSFAYALQKVHLFSASIRENLSFGLAQSASEGEMIEAARAAQILPEIKNFPEQWATQIGEKGLRLSGGQKQRLALARVFLRRPDVLLLDDVLSAVDNITEARLVQEFRKLRCTMLINSHRSSVLELCDRVIFLQDGQIRDEGLFSELIARHPELKEDMHDNDEVQTTAQ